MLIGSDVEIDQIYFDKIQNVINGFSKSDDFKVITNDTAGYQLTKADLKRL